LSKWVENLMPNEYVASIYDIDLETLRHQGKKLILSDLDNTLVPWNHPGVPPKLENWLRSAQGFGFTVCILSNNKGDRVDRFATSIGIPAISRAKKPSPRIFRQALRKFGFQVDEAVMVGDQLLTDIQGGNLAGLYTILVLPIHPKEYWGTKINRKIEHLFMKRLLRRGLVVPKQQ
jgi:uncharacterized protein